MDTNRIGVIAGIVGVLGLAVQEGPSILAAEYDIEEVVPMAGAPGETIIAYTLFANIVGLIVTVALAAALGYAVARRVDISREYRRVVTAIAIGSATGVIVAGAGLLASDVSTTNGWGPALLLAALGSMLVSVALLVTVGALAGAAIAHFRAIDDAPPRTTEDDTDSDSPSETYSGSTGDSSRTRSQPTQESSLP